MALTTQELAVAAPSAELGPTMSGQAYRALRADILSGEIEPGAKLKMEELQTRYHFSSSPLREALSRLAAEQIVTVDERRGFRAAPISPADLDDITQFRLVIEVQAFEISIRQGNTDWEAEIVAALHQLDAYGRGLPRAKRARDAGWVQRHKFFHMALIGASGSSRLLAGCSAMFDHSQRYRSLSPIHRDMPRDSAVEHRQLMEAALRRDAAAGATLLRKHIQTTADVVARHLVRKDDN